ncbi:MAG: hypothetical protein QW211_03020 [Desulfurococcaceae archaeon]
MEILRKMSDEELEKLVVTVEEETNDYLKQILPPKTDFNVSVSVERKTDAVTVSIDVTIRGRLEQYGREAKDAVNYAKRKLIEALEYMKSKYVKT